MKEIIILGIETSCDETAASVLKEGVILSDVVASQIEIHQKYGGVVPEIASRKHVETIISVIDEAIKNSHINKSDISAIAVTAGPGLVGALLVGLSAAKAMAMALGIPLIGVNHIEGHIAANFIANRSLEPPFISLVVSGSHSHIIFAEDQNIYKILGRTRDDAAGEAFDKVSRVLGLGYPGGPNIQKAAETGNKNMIKFQGGRVQDSLDFSFSGIKTAVMNYVNNRKAKGEEVNIYDIAASFQDTVTGILAENAVKACNLYKIEKLLLAGGVAANRLLREKLANLCRENGIKIYCPPISLCTDNGAMIACEGYRRYKAGLFSDLSLNAFPSLKIGEKF